MADPAARFRRDLDAIAPAGRIAVAVSGGPDSMALLLLAAVARPGTVVAATVDHRLRAEAAGEAAMVASTAGKLGIDHVTLPVRVATTGAGPQADARDARYAALRGWAREAGAAWLATAHHLDDQAETVLMRLARGAGVAGIQGVRRARSLGGGLTLIRPLLGWRKAELAAVVAGAGIVAVDDPSNADPRFDRTRARALLAQGWPPPERLATAAAWAAEAEAALAWSIRQLVAERLKERGGGIRLDVQDLPREYRRRLLLAALNRLAPDTRPRGDDVDRLLDRLDGGTASTLAGIRVEPGAVWRLTLAPPRRSG